MTDLFIDVGEDLHALCQRGQGALDLLVRLAAQLQTSSTDDRLHVVGEPVLHLAAQQLLGLLGQGQLLHGRAECVQPPGLQAPEEEEEHEFGQLAGRHSAELMLFAEQE